jgi:hypothetical protein
MLLLPCSISYGYHLYPDHLEHEIKNIQNKKNMAEALSSILVGYIKHFPFLTSGILKS